MIITNFRLDWDDRRDQNEEVEPGTENIHVVVGFKAESQREDGQWVTLPVTLLDEGNNVLASHPPLTQQLKYLDPSGFFGSSQSQFATGLLKIKHLGVGKYSVVIEAPGKDKMTLNFNIPK